MPPDLTKCAVCTRPTVMLHEGSPRCGYHKPKFSERTRKRPFQDFGDPAHRARLAHQRERHVERSRPELAPPARELGYKIVAISLYTADHERLTKLVAAARQHGVRRASKSALIRYALTLVEVHKLPEVLP